MRKHFRRQAIELLNNPWRRCRVHQRHHLIRFDWRERSHINKCRMRHRTAPVRQTFLPFAKRDNTGRWRWRKTESSVGPAAPIRKRPEMPGVNHHPAIAITRDRLIVFRYTDQVGRGFKDNLFKLLSILSRWMRSPVSNLLSLKSGDSIFHIRSRWPPSISPKTKDRLAFLRS